MRSCEWKTIRPQLLKAPGPWESGARSLLSKFYYKKFTTEAEILSAVYDGEFFGLLMVDIETPEPLKESFRQLNTGTIFTKIVVNEQMLKEEMHKDGIFIFS